MVRKNEEPAGGGIRGLKGALRRRDAATVITTSTAFWSAFLYIIIKKFIEVSEECTASLFRVEKACYRQETDSIQSQPWQLKILQDYVIIKAK
jgi:hypothetical protein